MTYEELQARLAEIAVQEADLRQERKSLEHELAAAKLDRPFDGPVIDADGNPVDSGEVVDSTVEGITARADGAGEEV